MTHQWTTSSVSSCSTAEKTSLGLPVVVVVTAVAVMIETVAVVVVVVVVGTLMTSVLKHLHC